MAVRGSIPLPERGRSSIAGFSTTLFFPDYPTPIPSRPPTKLRAPVFLAAKTGRRKIVRGGKDRMLAQPTAGGLHFRERLPRPGSSTKCQVSHDWSWPQEAPGAKTSLVQKRVEIGLSVDRTALGLQDVRCTTALPPKAEVHPQFRYVAEVPQAAVSNRSKASAYSMTSSAWASSVDGISRPSAFATMHAAQ